MSDIRTKEVDDLLRVLAALDDEEVVFALLEDLFTIREIRETSQRLSVARLLSEGSRTPPSRRRRALRPPPSPACRNA